MKNLSLLLAFLLVAAPAFASGGKKDGMHRFGEKMRQELKLTDQQISKMKEIRQARRERIKENKEKVKAARKEFHAALGNPKSTREELNAKYQALTTARQVSRDARFETMLEVRSVLAEDQIVKFHQLRNQWKDKRRGHQKKG